MSKETLKNKTEFDFSDVTELIDILCAPDGCPWDSVQTHQSIRNNFIEETYEVVEGIDHNDPKILREELGDVLLQVLLHSSIAKRQGEFTLQDVMNDLCKKLIFRHPHLFDENFSADTPEQAIANWEQLKKKEKGFATPEQTVASVSSALPALMRAQKLSAKAQKNGLIEAQCSVGQVENSVNDLKNALQNHNKTAFESALGDILFACASLANTENVNAEQTLFVKNVEFCDEICAK